jgi:hypothetical protein
MDRHRSGHASSAQLDRINIAADGNLAELILLA